MTLKAPQLFSRLHSNAVMDQDLVIHFAKAFGIPTGCV